MAWQRALPVSYTHLDKIKVAVPNDTTNEARALTLLEKNGFFKLKADAGLTATKNDIEENPLNVTVDEVEAAQVPNVLQDEDYAVINSNYAIPAGLDPDVYKRQARCRPCGPGSRRPP